MLFVVNGKSSFSFILKETFNGTGVLMASTIDISRLVVYAKQIISPGGLYNYPLVIAATLSGFAGSFSGNILKKITIVTVQYAVASTLFVFVVLPVLCII